MYNIEDIKNKIICGDNLEIMREIPDESIDLIYLDPPFFSNVHYEKIWGDRDEVRSFEDRWKGGINVYIEWMSDRLKEMQRILKFTGIIFLHCDQNAVDYLKIEMDKIFIGGYRTRIVWKKHTSIFGSKRNKFYPETSDYILVYTKSKEFTFNINYIPFSIEEEKEEIKVFKNPDNDPKGKYRWQYYPNNEFVPSQRTLKLNEESSIKFLDRTRSGTYKYKRYWNDTYDADGRFVEGFGKGKPMSHVWDDIYRLTSSEENLGYPTQKPEALLERIIISSIDKNKQNIILDPFVGGGTTIKVAQNNKLNFIGIDISLVGAKVAAKRLGISERDIIGLPSTIDDLRSMTPWEFQQWVCDKMQARNLKPRGGSDGGIDGLIRLSSRSLFAEDNKVKNKYDGCPIQVKQSESIGINVVKNLFATMIETKKNYGFIIAFSFASTAHEQVAIYRKDNMIDIKLLTAKDLCNIDKYLYEN